MRHWLGWTTVMAGICSVGCRDMGGTMLEIQHAIVPDATCSFNVSNNQSPQGFYDPRVDETGYDLVLVMRDNMESRTDDPALLNSTNVRNRQYDAQILGFEGCWYVFTGDPTKFGSLRAGDSGQMVDCSTLPNQSGSIPGVGSFDEGGLNQGLASLLVLTPEHLRQMFGSDFDPLSIPVGQTIRTTYLGNSNVLVFDPSAENPANPNRSKAWGTFPTSRSTTVMVQLRAIFRTLGGTPQPTNWFNFPITLCPACLQADCGFLVQQSCTVACDDGSTCTAGKCTDGTACLIPQLTGNVANFSAANTTQTICLPAQAYTAVDCSTHVGCKSQ